jgi:hypothetical protein
MTGTQALAERLRAIALVPDRDALTDHIPRDEWERRSTEANAAAILADGSVYLTPAEAARVTAIEEAARQLLTYPGPVRVTTEAHAGCEADECWVTALRAALEVTR